MRCTCSGELEADALFCGYCGKRTRKRNASAAGTLVDDTYRIDEKIAEGGFGAIYRATHLPSGATLALKILHADFTADPKLATRFRRESAALAQLRSPHTVITYERGEARDGTLYIAMELLHGDNLQQRFEKHGPMRWREVLKMMRAVCHSLGEAHDRGIIHRDLKPANIHLGTANIVKVLDFGVAKVLPWSAMDDGDVLTLAGQTVGTLEYMAPEQLVGAACDARTDIYALGVVAYEMLAGRRPFAEARNAPMLITAVHTQTPTLPSSVHGALPPAVDDIVMRCLERDPARRFSSTHELATALDRALRSVTPPAMAVQSHGGLQMVERHVAYVPALALRAAPEMPAFALHVQGTITDAVRPSASMQLAAQERTWLLWIMALVFGVLLAVVIVLA